MKFLKAFLLIASLSAIFLFAYHVTAPSREVVNQAAIQRTVKPTELETEAFEPLDIENVLILGRPGEAHIGSNMTDTIIVAHLNQDKGFLISLPRDFLIKNPLTKINSLYGSQGIDALKEKVSEITGLAIDRYVIIDLVVAEEVIDLIDGLNVFVPQDIYDPNFPGPGYTYDPFYLEAGWRYLDGRNVLRYVRTRYTSPNGDFDRMYRQQQVIRLLKQKILELNPLWDFPTYLKLFNTLQEHIITDISLQEMRLFWEAAKNVKAEDISTIVIDKKETELLTSGMVPFGQVMASCVWPRAGEENYQEIQEYIKERIQ